MGYAGGGACRLPCGAVPCTFPFRFRRRRRASRGGGDGSDSLGSAPVAIRRCPDHQMSDLAPFFIYAAIVLAIVGVMLGLSYFLGQSAARKYTGTPFESGIISVGSAQFRTAVHFYIPAILFIIFDLEVVFLLAWAVSVRETGWVGFIEIAVFIGILLAALFYLWRVGALDWRTGIQRRELRELRGEGGVVNKKAFEL